MGPADARDLAIAYAPILAQKVSREWKLADQIAPLDLAGSLTKVADNPEALERLFQQGPDQILGAKVYYSVAETSTHYFVIYAVYHVIDWWKRLKPKDLYNLIRDSLDEHIHDMEGALLVVTKEPQGLVDGLITVAHNNFYLHTEPRVPSAVGESRPASTRGLRVVKFNENVDGNIWLDRSTKRVKLYIESRGHGIRGDHKAWGSGDEIWYYRPEEEGGEPGTVDRKEQPNTRALDYELVDIFANKGLWAHRFKRTVFRQNKDGKWGFVYRDKNKLKGGAANPPWSWNDHNDTSPFGEIATDPARFIVRYAQGWGPVSTHYTYNPYLEL